MFNDADTASGNLTCADITFLIIVDDSLFCLLVVTEQCCFCSMLRVTFVPMNCQTQHANLSVADVFLSNS